MIKLIKQMFCFHKDCNVEENKYQIYTSVKYTCKKCGTYWTTIRLNKNIE